MCLCPRPALPELQHNYRISYLKCGSCPECLRERANTWVLRCVAESHTRRERGEGCCMVTLTYDQYLRDSSGNLIFQNGVPLELPPDRSKLCNKRDVQLFVKRLRKHFGDGIRYLITAEHGKRTHRAHYHAILFGVKFEDIYRYKNSKRGNQIYRSPLLEKIWKHGICTVDAVNIYGAMARYVTKYSMKDRGCADTFQLFSHGIGVEYLCEHFTGRPYILDGREYSIPRVVWNAYIMSRYGSEVPEMSSRYVAVGRPQYEEFLEARRLFRAVRNSDPVYQDYILRQSRRAQQFEFLRNPVEMRVAALDPIKYFGYKGAWYSRYRKNGVDIDPNASERVKRSSVWKSLGFSKFAVPSRQYTANDTKLRVYPDEVSADIIFPKNFRLKC